MADLFDAAGLDDIYITIGDPDTQAVLHCLIHAEWELPVGGMPLAVAVKRANEHVRTSGKPHDGSS